jgi:pimeloyl-ACP methyl ester carboxylesterase
MSKVLVLSGYGCRGEIWDSIITIDKTNIFSEAIFLEWPKEKLSDFHDVSNFSRWIMNEVDITDFDFVVGHSMGGLVALDLAGRVGQNLKEIILIESFIKTPSEFYQNLVMDNFCCDTRKSLVEMLRTESTFYSDRLGPKLKELDLSDRVKSLNVKLTLVYGDRGYDMQKVIEELGLDEEVLKLVDVKTVHNACHFPMIENPNELLNNIKSIRKTN